MELRAAGYPELIYKKQREWNACILLIISISPYFIVQSTWQGMVLLTLIMVLPLSVSSIKIISHRYPRGIFISQMMFKSVKISVNTIISIFTVIISSHISHIGNYNKVKLRLEIRLLVYSELMQIILKTK